MSEVKKKPERWYESFKNLYTQKNTPIKRQSIIDLGVAFLKEAREDENCLRCRPFFRDRGICSTTIAKWRVRYPEFDSLYSEGKQVIAERRDVGALIKKYDAGQVRFLASHYDDEARDAEKFRSQLKQAIEDVFRDIVYELRHYGPPKEENTP